MDLWGDDIALCSAIAENAHRGQFRRGGEEYIAHPRRVASQFEGMAACVAWLHDVIEDTDETVDTLREQGVDDSVLASVDLLTRRDGQDYWDYLTAIRGDGCCARRVKIADMLDNLCDTPTAKQKDKYRDGILWLATY